MKVEFVDLSYVNKVPKKTFVRASKASTTTEELNRVHSSATGEE
jgi:hypothetical protein